MNKDEYLDKQIKKIVNQDEVIPESVKRKKEEAYKEIRGMKKNNKNTHKKRWLVAAGLLAAMVISFQTPVVAEIKELLFSGYYRGVQTAIDNGALQKIEGVVSESNGIRAEIVGALMDPTVIQLRMKVSAEEVGMLKKFKHGQHIIQTIDNFTIIDDKGRVIQDIDEEGTYTVPITDENGKDMWLLSSSTEHVYDKGRENGEIYIDMILHSSEGNFEGIKGLTLQTKQIGTIKGEWSFQVDFNDTVAREGVKYQVTKSNDKIEVVDAVAYQTGLKIEFIVKVPINESIISDAKVIGQDGIIFETDRGGWMENTPEGERVVLTFEALEEDLGEQFELMVEDLEGKDEKVTLTKIR